MPNSQSASSNEACAAAFRIPRSALPNVAFIQLIVAFIQKAEGHTDPMDRLMKAQNLDAARMFSTVQTTLEEHETNNTWNRIAALVKAKGEFDGIITGISLHLGTIGLRGGAAL